MTTQQNKVFHALLAQTNLASQKANIVAGITAGRTEKSSEVSDSEAVHLINYLKEQLPPLKQDGLQLKADNMRKKILALAWQMNWTLVICKCDNEQRCLCVKKIKVDVERINNWCEKYGYLHKKLNQYSYQELPKLLTQFEKMYHDYLKAI